MKYPSDVKLEEMLPAAEDFASRYVELLKDAVLTIDEENSTAVLTFPKEAKSFDIKAFEAALADSIPAYVSAYAAANPRPAEPADIKVPENKAVSAIPAAPAAPASTPAATPAAPAKSASPAPVAAEQTAAVPAKSNAGTIILVVVISIIVIACIVYFVNRRKEK